MQKQFTPEKITELKENEVFVFGSNLEGCHSGGAAKVAMEKFGALWGQGVGLQWQSYAIPTMQGGTETIKSYVDEFINFASNHKELTFFVTRIGCGIAGFKDEEIAPLFKKALDIENIILPKVFDDILKNPLARSLEKHNIERFLDAQNKEYAGYNQALKEIKNGKKFGHWIWYIFPQLKGLGVSDMSNFYGIRGRAEGIDYIFHPILNERIHEISNALLLHNDKSIIEIFGELDAMKVKSSMTLFDELSPDDIFNEVLDTFFNGKRDERTLELLDKE